VNMPARPRIVIVGGGFAGIATAKALQHCDADITIIDRRNHHIFQPLLYQVATAVLAPSDVAAPIRQLAAKQKNVSVTLAEVVGVDLKSRSVDAEYPGLGVRKMDFDYLVIAAGTQSSYFGHNEFAKYAPCLKTMTDAEAIRTKILTAYELAESTDETDERQRQMTFVLVGGKRIESGTVLWTAGVSPSPLVKMLGVPTDRAGRACVGPLLNVPDVPWLFVIGDTATVMQAGRPLPGVAQVAIQQGRYVGRLITGLISGSGGVTPRPFRYFNKGNMAVIGKNFAIMESGRIRLAGMTAWLIWAFIHLMFLPQLQNRRRVQSQWLWSYFTGQRSSRLVAEAARVVT
jgi:NADH dehydrogenase FAD-containing subunit